MHVSHTATVNCHPCCSEYSETAHMFGCEGDWASIKCTVCSFYYGSVRRIFGMPLPNKQHNVKIWLNVSHNVSITSKHSFCARPLYTHISRLKGQQSAPPH